MESSTPPRRTRAGWTIRGAGALALVAALGGAAPPAGATASQLDLEIEAALAELPPERWAETIRFLLEAHLGTPGVHAVSPGSLWDRDAALDEQAFPVSQGCFLSDGGFGGCAYAPLRFRQGSTVTGLVMLFVDNWNGEDYLVEVRRKRTGTNDASQVMASAASSGASPSHRIATDLTIDHALIDNSLYAYFVRLCRPFFGSQLHGLYLTYSQ